MNLKSTLVTIALTIISLSGFSQSVSGNIVFERRTYWIEIMSKLPFVTQEDIDRDRLTWGKNQGRPQEHILHFNDDKSMYTLVEKPNDHGYSWKRDKFLIVRDHNNRMSNDQIDLLGKTYVIKDEVAKPKWKILNEIKEIAGYLCMKAETRDTVHNRVIHAWFTNGIPVQSGPEGFDGLPGMILGLEFNGGDVTVEAISVNLEADTYSLPLPKKIKGKEITRSDFDKKVKKHIRQSIGGERNPYWQMRY